MAWSKHNVGIDTSLEQDVAITGSLTVDTKIKLNNDTLTTATNIPLIIQTDSLIIKPYGESTPNGGILDVRKHDGTSIFKVNPNTGVVDINGSFTAGSIGVAALDLDNLDINGNIIKINTAGRDNAGIDNRVQIEQLLVKIGSDQADLFTVQDSSGANIINVDTTASPNLVSIDGLLSTGSRTNLGYGTNNAEVHVGASQKAYIGVGTQADFSNYFNNDAAVVINTVGLKGDGGSQLNIRKFNDSGYGNILAQKIQAIGNFRLQGTGAYISGYNDTDIDFQTNDETTVMRLETDTGFLGINTTTPGAALHAVGTNAGIFQQTAAADCIVTIQAGSTKDAILKFKADGGSASADITNIFQEDGVGLHIKTTNNTVDAMTILSAGSVGIGETSPDKLLHLKGDDVDGSLLKVEGNSSYGGTIEYHRGGSYHWRAGVGGSGSTNSNIPSSNFGIEDAAGSDTLRFSIGHSNGLISLNRTGNKEVARFTSTSITGSRITILSDSGLSSSVGERDGHLVLQDTNARRVAIGFDQPDTLFHMSGADPYMTFTNTASEDTAGGRESKLIFEGTTAAGGATYDAIQHHLAEMKVSHSGTGNDKKARFSISVNDGSDSNGSLTEMFAIDYGGDADGVETITMGEIGTAGYTRIGLGTDAPKRAFHVVHNPIPSYTFAGTHGAIIEHNDHCSLFVLTGTTRSAQVCFGDKDSQTKGFLSYDNTVDTLYIGANGVSKADAQIEIDSTQVKLNGNDSSLPNLTMANSTAGDSDGGRESKILFKGTTVSGGSTYDAVQHELAKINVSHKGSANDKKGKFEIFVNDGDDNDGSLQNLFSIDGATGDITMQRTLIIDNGYEGIRNMGEYLDLISDRGLRYFNYGGSVVFQIDTNNNIVNFNDDAVRFRNTTGSNDEDSRKMNLVFRGKKLDGTEHDMARISTSHSGIGDDLAGRFQIKVNDGDDSNNSLSPALYIGNAATGSAIGSTLLGLKAGENMPHYAVVMGYQALKNHAGSANGVAIGYKAMFNISGGARNIAIGSNALQGETGGANNSDNVGIGHNSLLEIDGGDYNIAIGSDSGLGITTGSTNIAIGKNTLTASGADGNNIAIGYDALSVTKTSDDGDGYNIALGNAAGKFCEEGEYNTFIGHSAGKGVTGSRLDGDKNTIIGYAAGYGITTTAQLNTFVGHTTAMQNTTGYGNVAMGYQAGYYNLTSPNNTYIGTQAGMKARGTAGLNTAIGYRAMYNGNNSDFDTNTANNNVVIGAHAVGSEFQDLTCVRNVVAGVYAGANMITSDDCNIIGYQAGYNLLSGNYNILIGSLSGYSLTDNANTICIGYKSGYALITGAIKNTLIGYEAGKRLGHGNSDSNTVLGHNAIGGGHNTATGNTANNNVAIGMDALGGSVGTSTNLTSNQNVVIGAGSGQLMESANSNVLVGMQSGYDLTTGDYNVVIGMQCGHNLTNHTGETYIGYSAGQQIVAGSAQNTFIGYTSGYKLGSSDNDGNTAVGYRSLAGGSGTHADNTGKYNTAIGASAYGGSAVTDFTASSGVCIGYEAGKNITTGSNNVIIGKGAGDSITTGEQNVAIGTAALGVLGTGKYETAVGYYALTNAAGTNVNGSLNAAFGYQAGKFVSAGRQNTFLGAYSGVGITGDRLTGNGNTGVGYYTLYKVQGAATNNAVFGKTAAQELTTGSGNTLLGTKAGENLVTGTNNTIVGFHAENSATDVNYEIVIGSGVDASNAFTGGGQDTVRIGRAAEYMEGDLTSNTWAHGSDRRIKKDIKDNSLGLEFINRLRTVTYKKKSASEHPSYFESYNEKDTQESNKKHYGFIAQEVKKAMQIVGEEEFSMWSEREDGMQQLSEASLIVPLVKAIQELSKEIKQLKGE